MPITYREVQRKQTKKFDDKVDKRRQLRCVIVDSLGNQSGSGSIWADQSARRLWVMPLGSVQPFQCLCVRIGAPAIGLGVIVGYIEGSNTLEVLRDDYEFLGPTNTGTSWMSPDNTDLQPGGRLQLWLSSKLIQPLSTFPSATGLTVNVVAGDYPYLGTRKTFPGQTSYALTINPNAGEHYFAGLYLDSANSLQVVYGASVLTTINPPPEPTWPAGSFRLSVVRINDTQTSITLASDTDTTNDIFDRRMGWSDEQAGADAIPKSIIDAKGDLIAGTAADTAGILSAGIDGQILSANSGETTGLEWIDPSGGWPFAHVLTVSTTDPEADHTTIADAITAAAAGDVILIDAETYAGAVTLNKDITLKGSALGDTILTNNSGTTTLTVSASGARVEDITVINSSTGNAVDITAAIATLKRVIAQTTAAAGSVKSAIATTSATKCTLIACEATASGGSLSNAGLLVTASGICEVIGGQYSGTEADASVSSGNTLSMVKPVFVNNLIISGGTFSGDYQDGSGNIRQVLASNDIYLGGDEAGVKQRSINTFVSSITDHFDGSALDADWSWAAYAGFVTPGGIVLSSPSMLQLHLSGAQSATSRAFAYRSTYGTNINCRCLPLADVRCGLRMDDGSNSNYVELFLDFTAGMMRLRSRLSVAGAVTGPTDVWATNAPIQFATLRLLLSTTSVYLTGYLIDGPTIVSTSALAVTAINYTRSGIYYEQLANPVSSIRAGVLDWYKQ